MATKKTKDEELTEAEKEFKARLAERKKEKEKEKEEADRQPKPVPVSEGPVGVLVDAIVNPTADKMLEFTNFDHNQVNLIPQVLLIDDMWTYLIDILEYRNDREMFRRYHPESPIPQLGSQARQYVTLLAKTRRSLNGSTLQKMEDLTLAELETRASREGDEFDRLEEQIGR